MWIAAPLLLALALPASNGLPTAVAVAFVAEAKGPPRALLARFEELAAPAPSSTGRYAYAAQLWRGEAADRVARLGLPAGDALAARAHFDATPPLGAWPEHAALGLRWRGDERLEIRLGADLPWQLLTEPLRLEDLRAGCQVRAVAASLRGPGELRRGLALVEVCIEAAPAQVLAPGAVLLVDARGQGRWWDATRSRLVDLLPGEALPAAGAPATWQVLEQRACQDLWTSQVLQLVDVSGTLTLEPSHGHGIDASAASADAQLVCSALLSGLRLDKNKLQRVDALVMAAPR